MVKISFLRHGESEINEKNQGENPVFSGRLDCSLSMEGKSQVKRLKNTIKNDYSIAYVSNSRRTIETFNLLNISPTCTKYTDALKERSLGILEGRLIKEFYSNNRYSDYWPNGKYEDFRHSFQNKAPGGESYLDIIKRIKPIIDEIKVLDENENVLIVSHLVTIRCFIFSLGYLNNRNIFDYYINNSEIVEIEI